MRLHNCGSNEAVPKSAATGDNNCRKIDYACNVQINGMVQQHQQISNSSITSSSNNIDRGSRSFRMDSTRKRLGCLVEWGNLINP
jgi:hypothetical protein